jgi:hypothetical protein
MPSSYVQLRVSSNGITTIGIVNMTLRMLLLSCRQRMNRKPISVFFNKKDIVMRADREKETAD